MATTTRTSARTTTRSRLRGRPRDRGPHRSPDPHPDPGPHPSTDTAWHDCEEDPDIPPLAWDAPTEFGLVAGLSADGGRHLLREVLELRHRLPTIWARVLKGSLAPWRARRIARHTIGTSPEVAAHLDPAIAPVADKAGPSP